MWKVTIDLIYPNPLILSETNATKNIHINNQKQTRSNGRRVEAINERVRQGNGLGLGLGSSADRQKVNC
jgi:hypothetical protein